MPYLLILCLFAGLLHAAEATPPRFTAEFRRGGTLETRVEGTTGLFVITNPSGIGGVTLTLVEGAWPRDVVFRFRYDDERGFTLLEHFGLETSRLVVHTFLHQQEKPAFRLKSADGKLDPDAPAAGTLNLTLTRTDAGVEARLPAHLLAAEKTVTVEWVDAYRE